jgi:hypothetical protein
MKFKTHYEIHVAGVYTGMSFSSWLSARVYAAHDMYAVVVESNKNPRRMQ